MKKLILKNKSYKAILAQFEEWLDILGYSQRNVIKSPNYIKEFLHYLESIGIKNLKNVYPSTIKEYYVYLSSRENEMFGGGLHPKTLNNHLYTLKIFNQFLAKHGATPLILTIQPERLFQSIPDILTIEEVKELFEIAQNIQEPQSHRDQTILICLYNLGLRLNEAKQLQIKDIDFDRCRAIVRKGKNGKQRQVPFNQKAKEILEDYIFEYRNMYNQSDQTEQLLIGIKGDLTDDGIRQALERLKNKSNIEKNIHPHLLRHSIASHLLHKGMDIIQIQQFLGHASLESTQIYTHITDN